jgi:hypothetical protein
LLAVLPVQPPAEPVLFDVGQVLEQPAESRALPRQRGAVVEDEIHGVGPSVNDLQLSFDLK